ncbi:hypothetical protein AB0L41_34750 [Amycolatopsis mediterranei]|uniref:hypothetical protein n=1 Tax=Amycolatopsis mediterranei TaxID=33910 RepID=UPI00341EE1FA
MRDPHAGIETIPLASLDDGPTVWIPDRDVIGIAPAVPRTAAASYSPSNIRP